jgi:hypothetical protein
MKSIIIKHNNKQQQTTTLNNKQQQPKAKHTAAVRRGEGGCGVEGRGDIGVARRARCGSCKLRCTLRAPDVSTLMFTFW